MLPAGNNVVTNALTQPRLLAGMNSCTSGRSTAYRPALPSPTKNRKIERNTQPAIQPFCPGVNAMTAVATARLTDVQMNTLRRPILSATQPQRNAPGTAPRPDDNRITAPCQ